MAHCKDYRIGLCTKRGIWKRKKDAGLICFDYQMEFQDASRDVLCPPEQSLEMYRWVKNAELAVIPGVDHFSIFLKADLIAVMMGHFMRQVLENR